MRVDLTVILVFFNPYFTKLHIVATYQTAGSINKESRNICKISRMIDSVCTDRRRSVRTVMKLEALGDRLQVRKFPGILSYTTLLLVIILDMISSSWIILWRTSSHLALSPLSTIVK